MVPSLIPDQSSHLFAECNRISRCRPCCHRPLPLPLPLRFVGGAISRLQSAHSRPTLTWWVEYRDPPGRGNRPNVRAQRVTTQRVGDQRVRVQRVSRNLATPVWWNDGLGSSRPSRPPPAATHRCARRAACAPVGRSVRGRGHRRPHGRRARLAAAAARPSLGGTPAMRRHHRQHRVGVSRPLRRRRRSATHRRDRPVGCRPTDVGGAPRARNRARSIVPGARPADSSITARRIADLFDRYAINRPQIIQQWQRRPRRRRHRRRTVRWSPSPTSTLAAAALAARSRRSIGVPHRAEQLPDLLADLRDGRLEPRPSRSGRAVRRRARSRRRSCRAPCARRRCATCTCSRPSLATRGVGRGAARPLGGRARATLSVDARRGVKHPLLRSWGRPAMEAAALVGRPRPVEHVHRAVRRPGASVHRPAPTAADGSRTTATCMHACRARAADEASSRSVRATARRRARRHACRSTPATAPPASSRCCATRSATSSPPTPRCSRTTSSSSAPTSPASRRSSESVFRRGSLPIPVRVTDLSLGTQNPVAGRARSPCSTSLAGRCTGGRDARAVLARPGPRAGSASPTTTLERIDRWIGDLGTTWGLDGEHRGRRGSDRRSPTARGRPRSIVCCSARRCRRRRPRRRRPASCRSTTSTPTALVHRRPPRRRSSPAFERPRVSSPAAHTDRRRGSRAHRHRRRRCSRPTARGVAADPGARDRSTDLVDCVDGAARPADDVALR